MMTGEARPHLEMCSAPHQLCGWCVHVSSAFEPSATLRSVAVKLLLTWKERKGNTLRYLQLHEWISKLRCKKYLGHYWSSMPSLRRTNPLQSWLRTTTGSSAASGPPGQGLWTCPKAKRILEMWHGQKPCRAVPIQVLDHTELHPHRVISKGADRLIGTVPVYTRQDTPAEWDGMSQMSARYISYVCHIPILQNRPR